MIFWIKKPEIKINRTGAEVNPESWTQLKGSHEAQIKFGRETCSD